MNGGGRRIRTFEGSRRQIYSLVHLATLVSHREDRSRPLGRSSHRTMPRRIAKQSGRRLWSDAIITGASRGDRSSAHRARFRPANLLSGIALFLPIRSAQIGFDPLPQGLLLNTGASRGDRTPDLRFTKPLLYQLSYASVCKAFGNACKRSVAMRLGASFSLSARSPARPWKYAPRTAATNGLAP